MCGFAARGWGDATARLFFTREKAPFLSADGFSFGPSQQVNRVWLSNEDAFLCDSNLAFLLNTDSVFFILCNACFS